MADMLKGFISGTTEWDIYWSTRPHKTWVVNLKPRNVRVKVVGSAWTTTPKFVVVNDKRTMYVRSRSKTGAAKCALDNLFCGEKLEVDSVRLATATDLGCVRINTTGESV